MELYKELIAKEIGEIILQTISEAQINYAEIAENMAYKALSRIKTAIGDDGLSDFDCVEQIVCVFEEFGIDSGHRHDF